MSQNNEIIMDRVPPQAIDIENAILGSLILEKDTYYKISDLLSPESFYDYRNKKIFKIVTELIKSGRPVDLLILTKELKNRKLLDKLGGPLYLTQLTNRVASVLHIEHHARILKQTAVARNLISITSNRNQQAYDESIDIEDTLNGLQNDIINLLETDEKKEHTISDAINEVKLRIEKNRNNEGFSGIATGLLKFDRFTGGLQSGDLIVIAAESSQGKTSLALTILKNSAMKEHTRAAVYSLEMTKSQLTARLIAQESGISAKKILNKTLSNSEAELALKAAERLKELPIFFDEQSTNSIEKICNSIRKLKLKHNIELVIVDYLQLVNSNLKNKTDESQVAEISRRLKNIAKELNIPIIALSQLSREKQNPKPNKNRLRGSGQIEEAADILLLLWRPEEYGISEFSRPFEGISTKSLAEVTIAKGRNVGTGSFLLNFKAETTSFYDYDNQYNQDYNPDSFIESNYKH